MADMFVACVRIHKIQCSLNDDFLFDKYAREHCTINATTPEQAKFTSIAYTWLVVV